MNTEFEVPATSYAPLSASVIICCYDVKRFDDLCAAISSALAQNSLSPEVVVVVDHNPELKRLVTSKFPNVSVVENRFARGLSGARNSGIAASSGALIAFLDDDAFADPGMIAALQKNILCGERLGAVAKIEPFWRAGAPKWFPQEFLWVVGCTYVGMKPGRVRNLIGAAMCIRRTVFDEVGGFTDGIGRGMSRVPYGCEETELCIRANAAHPGAWFEYDPAALCSHIVSPQRATWRYFASRCYAEGWSKAHIAALVRSNAALSSEWTYVIGTLLGGFLRGWRDLFVKGDLHGPMRAAAIALGLFVTLAGYLAGKIKLATSVGDAEVESNGDSMRPNSAQSQ